MRRTRFDDAPCPIARTTDLMGDWWTPLVMREAFSGVRRFGEFAQRLDIPKAVLTARLARLVEEDMLDRVEYQSNPPRYEYRLTDKGRDFWNVLAAMWRWGSDWLWAADDDGAGGEPPIALLDRVSGHVIKPLVVDEHTGQPLDLRTLCMGRNPVREPSAATTTDS